MAKEVVTSVQGRSLTLTNLDKILFEKDQIVKAQLIAYYMDIGDKILLFTKDRAATLIRYPDGAMGKSFYSKNLPEWTPNWIASTKLGADDHNNYLLINDLPTLIWVANMAALEIHTVQFTMKDYDKPDTLIFDIDPPEGKDFSLIKEIATDCYHFLKSKGYHPHIKTSGSKGIHIYVPIKPIHLSEAVVQHAKVLAEEFVRLYPSHTTLNINKDKRDGKVFIDILRNHGTSTCAIPFSTRGRSEGSISMPMSLGMMEKINSSKEYTISNYKEYIDEAWNTWKDFNDNAVDLKPGVSQLMNDEPQVAISPQLEAYTQKRDFTKTNEPPPYVDSAPINGKRYCLQLHDASNLHYDLRIEHNGTLLSWAVPKGLPINQDEKRLAIRTEDHPLKYLSFEGVIPKEEYGGGTMWLLQQGTLEHLTVAEKKIKFGFEFNKVKYDYQLINTKDSQWLISNLSEHASPKPIPVFEPMLASLATEVPTTKQYFFEVKWDGIRALIYKNGDKVQISSRAGNDISSQFPEIIKSILDLDVIQAVIDCELVVLDAEGRPIFKDVISRLHNKNQLVVPKPCHTYCFDLLWLNGWDMTNYPNEKRKEIVQAIIDQKPYLRNSDAFEDGEILLQFIGQRTMEGIICKSKNAKYVGGKRSNDWLKIKVNNTDELTIIGYTKGEGDRTGLIGAIHVANIDDNGSMVYLGKVGTGFDTALLKDLTLKFQALEVVAKPIPDKIEEESRTIWIAPKYKCKVKYASITNTGMLREPVFQGLVLV